MRQHLLEHLGVAVLGHLLEGIGEVAVVGVGARGDARSHRLVQLRRVQSPLLAGVAAEELLVQLAADAVDHHVFAGLDVLHRLGTAGEKICRFLFGGHVQTVEPVQRGHVDRDRHLLAIHLRQHAVFVGAPLGELREVVDDALGVGVEDVRAVAVNQHAGFVVVIVGVAGDMRAPVDHQHALVQAPGQPLGEHAAGETGADDQVIEATPARL